ncbi:acyltransferase family protein [Dactylosporangium sp. NPDC049140]|uniref:acyltransferase family protein n=1 Tax=Dactylosporangium sp. NPDC049140 TaxID=3155647 RepID=UPI0033E45C60
MSLRYQPSLDGLRAVALGGVLLAHGLPAVLPGGFLGVDLFFVLSGYLITSLLLDEYDSRGRLRLGEFWRRRARRLMPALALVVAFVVLAGPRLLPGQDPAPLRPDAVAALTYWANWRMIYRGGDYFTQTAAASPLQHTWSLAIEEQFYLLWPLLLMLAGRLPHPRRWIGAGALAGAAASAVAAAVLYDPAAPDRVYFGTDTRASALLIGAALAAAPPGLRGRRWAAAVGAAVLAAAALGVHGDTAALYRGGFVLIALAAAALVAAPARVLGVAPLRWIGRVSYGGYLWHWPLFAILDAERTGLAGPPLFAVRVGATLAVAAASFHLVEQPVRRRRPLPAIATAAAAIALLAAVPAEKPRTAAAVPPVPATPAAAPVAAPAVATPPVRRAGRRPGPPRVTVIGDSVSWTLGAYWPGAAEFTLSNQGVQGCGIAVLPDVRYGGALHANYPYCATWESRWGGSVAADDPDVVVILLDRWELMDRRLGDRWTHVGEADYDAYLTGQLDRALDLAAAHGARVALLSAPYTHREERPDGGLWPEDEPARVDAWNRLLARAAADHPSRPVVLDLNRVLCPAGAFAWTVGGVRVRSDGLHLTPDGVRQIVAPWLAPQLARLATI